MADTDDMLFPPGEASATFHRIVHCCIDIRGMLRWPKRKLRGLMVDDDGKRLTPEQAREYLLDQIALGRRVLPLGGECEGFSYETGCPGHGGIPRGQGHGRHVQAGDGGGTARDFRSAVAIFRKATSPPCAGNTGDVLYRCGRQGSRSERETPWPT